MDNENPKKVKFDSDNYNEEEEIETNEIGKYFKE